MYKVIKEAITKYTLKHLFEHNAPVKLAQREKEIE